MVVWFVGIGLLTAPSFAQKTDKYMTGSAARQGSVANLKVVPDLPQRLAKWRRTEMPFHSQGLSAQELKMVNKLVDACRYLEEIFWRQNDPEGLQLYQSLAGSQSAKIRVATLSVYQWFPIRPAGREQAFRGNHADAARPGLLSGRTDARADRAVREGTSREERRSVQFRHGGALAWKGTGRIPYHVAYRSYLEAAAKDLREAAGLSADAAFAKFLRLRADALLTRRLLPKRPGVDGS